MIHRRGVATWCGVAGAAGLLILFSGCGGNVSTEGWKISPNQPVTDTGSNWNTCSSPSPSPTPSPSPSPSPSSGGWCSVLPWWPGCGSSGDHPVPDTTAEQDLQSPPPATGGDCSMHNTRFCQVDEKGNILSGDMVSSDQQGSLTHGITGGCIQRPIRELWAVIRNNNAMRPGDVDEYNPTERPDIVAQMGPESRVEFVVDIFNLHRALMGLVNPSWTVRWVHSVPYGTYEHPNEVAVNFQKIEGTSHIRQLFGGYVLDRVTDTITSYAMEQWVDADQYGTNDSNSDLQGNFPTMRQGAPDWNALPDQAPVELPLR